MFSCVLTKAGEILKWVMSWEIKIVGLSPWEFRLFVVKGKYLIKNFHSVMVLVLRNAFIR